MFCGCCRQNHTLFFSCVLFGDFWCPPWIFHQPGIIFSCKVSSMGPKAVECSLCPFHPPGIISFSFKASSTWPGSCWVILALPTIPSTSNHYFFAREPLTRQGFCNKLKTSPWLFHPPGIIIFMSIVPRSCFLLLASLLL